MTTISTLLLPRFPKLTMNITIHYVAVPAQDVWAKNRHTGYHFGFLNLLVFELRATTGDANGQTDEQNQ